MKVIGFQPWEQSQNVDGKDYPERELTEPYSFVLKTDREFWYCEIQEGYVWNGASIPKAFWGVVGGPFSGKYILAALIHDMLYDTHITSREEADDIFRQVMELDGVPSWKTWLMWKAVRIGGAKPWKKSNVAINLNRRFVIVDKRPIRVQGNSAREVSRG